MMRKIFFGLAGILTTSCLLKLADVIQGLILEDWSGLHPIFRIFQLPFLLAVSFMIGIFIMLIFRLFNLKTITATGDFFKIGLALGSVGIGSVIHPWIVYNQYAYWVIIFFVFIISLAMSIWFSIRKSERVASSP